METCEILVSYYVRVFHMSPLPAVSRTLDGTGMLLSEIVLSEVRKTAGNGDSDIPVNYVVTYNVLVLLVSPSSGLSKAPDFPQATAWCDGLYNLLNSNKFIHNKLPRKPPHLSLREAINTKKSCFYGHFPYPP